jgi:hypothetical protein
MFWTIIGAILFLTVGVPVIFYCAALLLGGIGDFFSNIVELPKKYTLLIVKTG